MFCDTPGYHSVPKAINQYMMGVIENTIQDCDLFCLLIDADAEDLRRDQELWERLHGKDSLVIVNKTDLLTPQMREQKAMELRDLLGLKELFFISAKTGDGVEELVRELETRLHEGEPFFPSDIYTELPVRFMVAEAIREQAMLLLHQEIPYGIAVEVTDFEEKPQITVIKANIIVERMAHKSMVIGSGGQMIKKIGTRAREKAEFLMGDQKVFLELTVKVEEDWTRDAARMAQLGYS